MKAENTEVKCSIELFKVIWTLICMQQALPSPKSASYDFFLGIILPSCKLTIEQPVVAAHNIHVCSTCSFCALRTQNNVYESSEEAPDRRWPEGMLLPAQLSILEPDFSQKSRKQVLPHQIDILTSDLRAPMRASHGRSCLRNGIMLIQNEYDRFYLGNGIMLIRTEHITGGICFHHSDHS